MTDALEKITLAAMSLSQLDRKELETCVADTPAQSRSLAHWERYIPQSVSECWRDLPMVARLTAFMVAEAEAQSQRGACLRF